MVSCIVIPCLDNIAFAVPRVLRGDPSASFKTTSVCWSGIPLACVMSRAVTFAPVSGKMSMSKGLASCVMKQTLNCTVSSGINFGAIELISPELVPEGLRGPRAPLCWHVMPAMPA